MDHERAESEPSSVPMSSGSDPDVVGHVERETEREDGGSGTQQRRHAPYDRAGRGRQRGAGTPPISAYALRSRAHGHHDHQANFWGNCRMIPELSMSAISRISRWTCS